MASQDEQIVRRHAEIVNSSESVDQAMAALEPLARILRIEWHYDAEEARARFERGA